MEGSTQTPAVTSAPGCGHPQPHAGPAILGGPRPPAKQGPRPRRLSGPRPSQRCPRRVRGQGAHRGRDGCDRPPGSRPPRGRCGGGGSGSQRSRPGSPSAPGRTGSGTGRGPPPAALPRPTPGATPTGSRGAPWLAVSSCCRDTPPARQLDKRVRGATPPPFGAVAQRGGERSWGPCPADGTPIFRTPGGWASAPRRPRVRPPL